MTTVDEKIARYENLMLSNDALKNSWGIALRHYENYRLGSEVSIQKALRVCTSAYKANVSAAWLLLGCAFFHAEMGTIDSAEELLNTFKPYRNYYKSNKPEIFAMYTYVQGVLETKMGKNRAIKKQLKTLLELKEKFGGYYIDLMIADMYCRQEDYMRALDYLEISYETGCRSFYLYILYHDLQNANVLDDNGYLLIPFLKWAKVQNCLKTYFIDDNDEIIDELFDSNVDFFETIFESVEVDSLLSRIVEYRLNRNDLSKEAYGFYKKAEQKQLDVFGLTQTLIKCGFTAANEDVSLYTMHSFLEKYEIEIDLMPYIFHLLLTKHKMAGLIEEFDLSNKMLQYSMFALSSKMSGRWFNSIYVYLLTNIADSGEEKLEEEVARFIFPNLFISEVSIKDFTSGFIWVFEKEKTAMSTYKIENGKCIIKTATNNVKLIVTDNEQKNILNKRYSVERLVANANSHLYKYYIDKGYEDLNLQVALACIYVNSEQAGEEQIEVLNKVLSINALSKSFRMQVGAGLGNILSHLQLHDKALQYFNEVDENLLNERYIEIMLTAFINVGELSKAFRLVIKKREYISDRTLFWALKQLVKNKELHSGIADAAYELLIKNYYDAKLLRIVIHFYIGSQTDWLFLKEALNKMSISDMALDEKILENAIRMHDFSADAQSIFHRLYKLDKGSELLENFIYYACFEMCINIVKPEYEVITVFEKIFEQTNDRLMAYALTRVYMKHSISTFNSNDIIEKTVAFMEADGIILPEFKDVKDKNILTPYIEKNQPFLYRSSADKTVLLYYKIDGDTEFSKRVMKHIGFGTFSVVMPLFYNEVVTYFFSEEMKSGSINTKETTITNTKVNIKTGTNDSYFLINNALIYDQMFKYGEAEKIITDLLKDSPQIKGRII